MQNLLKLTNKLQFNFNHECLKSILKIIKSYNFQNDFFKTIENQKPKKNRGINGKLIEKIVLNYLNEKKCFNNLIINQSSIKQLTTTPVDFIIENNLFQLKTINLNKGQLFLKLFYDSKFPIKGTVKEKIQSYNSKIANTLILAYCEKTKTIEVYFLSFNELLIKNKDQYNEKCVCFNCTLSYGITTTINQKKKCIFLNVPKNHKLTSLI